MPDAGQPALFSIPPHKAFADALVAGLLAQHQGDELALARGIILVPNNRAAMAIQDGFVRQAEKGLLLPRLVPIGDPDLGDHVGSALDPIEAEPIPPAIPPLTRQLILARKLQQTMAAERLGPLDGAQAMRLAQELGRVIDQLLVEQRHPRELRDVDVSGLSDFWKESLNLLGLILEDWPKELAARGMVDMAERRNQQLTRVAERWRNAPPEGFVVAAGIGTSAPAVANLIRCVARLPRGAVVLAGLDFELPEAAWDALAGDDKEVAIESHPQYHLRRLLDRIGVARAEVEPWGWGVEEKSRATRITTVNRAMAPASFTRDWAELDPAQRRLPGVTALELATPAEEAQAIALAIRHAIETPTHTVALITPDRNLALRVVAHLGRWGILADDSAGQPLSASLPGQLLLSLAHAASTHFQPVALLNLFKHPLVKAGDARLDWLNGVRAFDLAIRGPKPAPHLAGIDAYLAHGDERTQALRELATPFWSEARELLAPVEAVWQAKPRLPDMLAALRDGATALGGDALWSGQDGRALADLWTDLMGEADLGPMDVAPGVLPHLLQDLMGQQSIRPARGGHPRIHIWGLLEARLQSADTVILAGLNEGDWPQLSAPDPWLAPAVRRQLGLPALEYRIGLSAHDLVGGLGAGNVILTRARRDMRAPTIPSRFWLRLETLANGFLAPTPRYDEMARGLDFATGVRATRPAPAPDAAERPRKISVTEVDGLKADPYAFYARHMLSLSALEAPGAEPDARWRGTFLHKVLGDWGELHGFAPGKLVPLLSEAFETSGLHPVIRAMWQPRFEEAMLSFEKRVAAERAEGREPKWAEIKGTTEVAGVRLTGRADRIDALPDGGLAIIDYKTDGVPSDKKVAEGFALQLGLIGFMAEAGAFADVAGLARAFEYWSMGRAQQGGYGYVKSPTSGRGANKSDPDSFVADMFREFENAVDGWLLGDAPFTAKLHPDYAYSEYDHLMRYDEWQGRNG